MVRYLPVILAVGALIYGLIWLMQARARRSPGPPSAARGRRGPVAPDDDPEFLAQLDRLRREQQRKPSDKSASDAAPRQDPTTPAEEPGGTAPGATTPRADRPAAPSGGQAPSPEDAGADETPGTEADGSHR